jgi:surfeit locus 1 family protein
LPRHATQLAELQHRRAQLRGRWLSEESIYLDNRPMAGRTGFYVVTPLLLDDGSAVLVQRGWTPRDQQDRTRVAPPPPAPGVVQVGGRIAPALARLYEFDGAASGPIRQNLDIDAYARETKRPLRPWVLIQDSPPSPPDGLLRQWPEPGSGVHKHHGYAFQWFSLSALTIGLYVWFQFVRPHRRRAA